MNRWNDVRADCSLDTRMQSSAGSSTWEGTGDKGCVVRALSAITDSLGFVLVDASFNFGVTIFVNLYLVGQRNWSYYWNRLNQESRFRQTWTWIDPATVITSMREMMPMKNPGRSMSLRRIIRPTRPASIWTSSCKKRSN